MDDDPVARWLINGICFLLLAKYCFWVMLGPYWASV